MVLSVLKLVDAFSCWHSLDPHLFPPWRKHEKISIIHNMEGYDIWILPPVGYVPIYPNSISRRKQSCKTDIQPWKYSNNTHQQHQCPFDGLYWQLIALMGPLLPNSFFSSDFGWFLMRKYKHSKNCKVGGHHCLPKSTTGKKLRNCWFNSCGFLKNNTKK